MASPTRKKVKNKTPSKNVIQSSPKKILTKQQKEEQRRLDEVWSEVFSANQKKEELEAKEKVENDAKLEQERFIKQKQEAEQLLQEYNDLDEILEKHKKLLKVYRNFVWDEWKWQKYINCDESMPDCTELKEVNSFISLAKDNLNLDGDSLNFVDSISQTQKLLFELEERSREANMGDDNGIVKDLDEAYNNLTQFSLEILSKLSYHCFSTAKEFLLSRTGNYQCSFNVFNAEIYLWANFALSQRIKHNSFGCFGVDFSTSICTNPVSIRVVHYKTDRLSIEASSNVDFWQEFYITDPLEVFQSFALPPVIPIPKVKPPEIQMENNIIKVRSKKKKKGDSQSVPLKNEKKLLKDYLAKTSQRTKKNLLRTSLLNKVTTIWQGEATTSEKKIVIDPIEINLAEMTIIDGVYELSFFNTPPQSVKVGQWTVQNVTDEPNLITFHYPPSEISQSEGPEYLSVTMKLPKEDVFLYEEPTPAMWDANSKMWKKSVYITHPEYDKEQGILKFRMTKPGSLAFFQRNSLHFQFLSWQLMSDGKNRAKFFVRTELMKLNFEIKNDKIILAIPEKYEWPKLRPLSQKFMTLQEMANALINIGVYIFPNEKMTGIKLTRETKRLDIEMNVYKNMAWCLGFMAFQQSRWNSELPRGQIAVRSIHNEEIEKIPDESWPVYLHNANKVEKLKLFDNSPKFEEILTENLSARQNLPRLLLDDEMVKAECLEDILSYNSVEFTFTIFKWLRMLRVLSYSQ